MLLAETVTFDPGVVVLVVVVFLAFVLTVATVVIGGFVAGIRSALDPSRTRAQAVWATCATFEGAVLAFAVLQRGAPPIVLGCAAVFALTVLAKVVTPAR